MGPKWMFGHLPLVFDILKDKMGMSDRSGGCFFVTTNECALLSWFANSAMQSQVMMSHFAATKMPESMKFFSRQSSLLADLWLFPSKICHSVASNLRVHV